jgi:hypothetical protein
LIEIDGGKSYNFLKGDATMNTNSENHTLFRQPGAWIPLAMSLLALALILVYVAFFGIARNGNGDEGAPARIFQLLMVLQLPVAAYFAFRWLPRRPKEALIVLVAQAVAWIIPIATIIWLECL